jgi:hypothetical protein
VCACVSAWTWVCVVGRGGGWPDCRQAGVRDTGAGRLTVPAEGGEQGELD